MILKADTHIHVDQKGNHGIDPIALARRVNTTDLDLIAVLEHNKITTRALIVEAELQRLASITGKKAAQVLWAIEGGLRYRNGGERDGYYHFVHLFEDSFTKYNRPDNFPHKGGPNILEQYKASYPGRTIGAHLTWLDYDGKNPRLTNTPEMTEDLMGSGLFEGVEIVSASNIAFLERTPRNQNFIDAIDAVRDLARMYSRVREKLHKAGVTLAPMASSDGHFERIVGGVFTEFEGGETSDIFGQIDAAGTKAVIDVETPRQYKRHIGENRELRDVVRFQK